MCGARLKTGARARRNLSYCWSFGALRIDRFCGLKANLAVSAIAKRFVGRGAATAKRKARFFHRDLITLSIEKFDRSLHNVWSVLLWTDCYVSHARLPGCFVESCNP